jgi:hypothetical protein
VVDIKGTTKFPGVSGQFHFTQTTTGGPVIVRGTIQGLTPGLHGVHIHQFGNLSDNCNAAGPHFNPFNVKKFTKQFGSITKTNLNPFSLLYYERRRITAMLAITFVTLEI